jgi:hypothetical protein
MNSKPSPDSKSLMTAVVRCPSVMVVALPWPVVATRLPSQGLPQPKLVGNEVVWVTGLAGGLKVDAWAAGASAAASASAPAASPIADTRAAIFDITDSPQGLAEPDGVCGCVYLRGEGPGCDSHGAS